MISKSFLKKMISKIVLFFKNDFEIVLEKNDFEIVFKKNDFKITKVRLSASMSFYYLLQSQKY